MEWHPSESQLQEFLDDELQGEEYKLVRTHTQVCTACQAAVAAMRALLVELESLPTEAVKTPALWSPPGRVGMFQPWAFAAVAAVLVFAIGFFVGVRTGQAAGRPATESDGRGAQLAEAIQREGTQYVHAIAKWRRGDSRSDKGREVALAALYGAAFELQKLRPDDAQVSNMVRTIDSILEQATEEGSRERGDRKP